MHETKKHAAGKMGNDGDIAVKYMQWQWKNVNCFDICCSTTAAITAMANAANHPPKAAINGQTLNGSAAFMHMNPLQQRR